MPQFRGYYSNDMTAMRLNFLFLAIIGYTATVAQVIPEDRTESWTQAGMTIPCLDAAQTIVFTDAGGDPTGSTDNSALLNGMMDTLAVPTRIIFPSGNYLFESQLQLKGDLILSGSGASSTSFYFSTPTESDLIVAKGKLKNDSSELILAAGRHDSVVTVADAGIFLPGDHVLLIDNDNYLVDDDWALESTGQILVISSISGNEVTFTSRLRRSYSLGRSPRLKRMEPVERVGIEDLAVINLSPAASQKSSIFLKYVSDSYIKGIESYNTNYAHIELHHATHCTVSGNYMQDAFDYGDGGKGYGVLVHYNSGENLVIDNIANHLRHSYLLQAGANGNVIAYNYSTDPYWTGTFLPASSAGDLVLHGNFPYANLLEGNQVQNIVVDDAHGKNGPFNTFFRNRAEGYGLSMTNASVGDSMHFVGNEITNTGFLKGLYLIAGTGHIEYGNNLQGDIFPSGTDSLSVFSYFDAGTPWVDGFPMIGTPTPINSFEIPTAERFASGSYTFHEPCIESCTEPESLFASPVLSDKAKLNWTSSETRHEVSIREAGTATWDRYRSMGTSLPVAGLSPSTTYEWRIRTRCADEWSAYTAISTFTTDALRLTGETPAGLFPNPASGVVKWTVATEEPVFVRISHISGQLLMEEMHTGQWTLDVSGWEPGTYLVEISETGSKYNYRLVVL